MNAPEQNSAVGAAMVVGGGIGGMQAALDLADAGIKVYLVETTSAIGGRMAQLDKTFPTNDCAMCTMAPRLVEIGRHRDIEILTLSDVERVEGQAGNFAITVKRRARFVDETRCTGCGLCTTSCPVTLPSEFDLGLGQRKAIYRPFPQAVPNVFAISRRGASPCQAACPIHQSAQGYVALVAQGRFDEALAVILRENPIPSICGRICTHPCETACTRRNVDDPINMPALKRFVTDRRPDYQLPKPSAPERPERIAVVGSGPAGLMCAYHLRQKGYQPVVFEALPVAGGMLAAGIPSFRLPRPVLNAELDRLRAIGIEIRVNTLVGGAIPFDELRRQYAAVFVAIGAHLERRLAVPGEDLPGVTGGLEFLRRVNLEGPQAAGRRVLVIGGGNSALDAARTARRCGAEVTLVYRRTRAEMPADSREVEDAEREGVKLIFLVAPTAFRAAAGSGAGRLGALQCVRMQLGAPDASGRPAPQPIQGSEFVLPCDTVIVSIGQTPDVATLGERLGIETTKGGTLRADPVTLETTVPGVFVGGDCVTGPDVVVTAMLAGKRAAISIDRWLNGQDLRAGREFEGPYATQYKVDTAGAPIERQVPLPALEPAGRARTFDEVHIGYTEEQAVAEARRCLSCGICSDCHMCADACQAGAIDFGLRDVTFASYGDMLRVPGSDSDLFKVKAAGGDVRIVYSPMEALKLARALPKRQVVFFGIGFETTAPPNAMAVWEARREGLDNFSMLVSHVLVPPAIRLLLGSPRNLVQGFIAPGHVCTVMGYWQYEALCRDFHVPIVVGGFEPVDLMEAVDMLVAQLEEGRAVVENQYVRSVRYEGNLPAQRIMEQVLEVCDRKWRGIGVIPQSGLRLREEFAAYDAERIFGVGEMTAEEPPECISAEVLQGLKRPTECPVFGVACTPENPMGAPMVSAEGACAAYYHFRRHSIQPGEVA